MRGATAWFILLYRVAEEIIEILHFRIEREVGVDVDARVRLNREVAHRMLPIPKAVAAILVSPVNSIVVVIDQAVIALAVAR